MHNFSGGTVMFGPLPAKIISTSDTRIVGKTPVPAMKGFRPVSVTVGDQTYTVPNGFKYIWAMQVVHTFSYACG